MSHFLILRRDPILLHVSYEITLSNFIALLMTTTSPFLQVNGQLGISDHNSDHLHKFAMRVIA